MLSWSRTDEEEAENFSKTEADELGGSWRCRRCKLVCVCFFLKGKADISSPTSARKLKCRRRLQETNPPGSSSVNHSSAGSQHRVINSKIMRYFFFPLIHEIPCKSLSVSRPFFFAAAQSVNIRTKALLSLSQSTRSHLVRWQPLSALG